MFNATGAVGIAEMGDEGNFIHLGQGVQTRPGRAKACRRKTQPVHATVELQENPVRLLGLVPTQPVDLVLTVHRVPQLQSRAYLQVARLERPLQQPNRTPPAQGAQTLGLRQIEQGKAVRPTQALKDPLNAMSIGIGLDHRPHACIGCGSTQAG